MNYYIRKNNIQLAILLIVTINFLSSITLVKIYL